MRTPIVPRDENQHRAGLCWREAGVDVAAPALVCDEKDQRQTLVKTVKADSKTKCRLAPNIGAKGRMFRALGAAGLVLGGLGAWRASASLAVVLILAGAFVLFEAARGWCALRACGIKTRF